MKNTVSIILILVCTACFLSQEKVAAQGTVPQLTITNMVGFPLFPGDTLFENQPFTFQVTIQNISNNNLINDTIFLEAFVDSVQQSLFTIALWTQQNLNASDSITLNVTSYQPSAINFKAGSNIVVVWPRSSQPGTTIDSLTLSVYFVGIQGTTDIAQANNVFSVFPNPVSGNISLNKVSPKSFEYVRIFDASGQVVYRSYRHHDFIETALLRNGIYFIELKERNKISSKRKFVLLR